MRGWNLSLLFGLAGCADMSIGMDSSSGLGSDTGDTAAQTPTGLTAGAWDDNLNYDWFEDYVAAADANRVSPLTAAEREAARDAFAGDRPANERLDIAILLDTTGSMGDEHQWLVDELGGIAAAIESFAPGADTRWALVVYRDSTDAYTSRTVSDFTRDLSGFKAQLSVQSAEGGGDYPEAADKGLQDVLSLGWRTEDDVARLVFWIADAPPHDNDADRVARSFRDFRDADVHLYPIAASGTDPVAELTMRSGAQLTGGRYLFLTDDSGIGYAHAEPTLPCYFVTLLSEQVPRMVEIELTGRYREPDAEDVIRTGGDPTDRRCTLGDGSTVIAF